MSGLDLSSLSFDGLIAREWLATFGNGAYASSTLASLNTRKYHGLLVAAMAPPVRRMVLLSRVEEHVRSQGRSYDLAANEYPGCFHPEGHRFLRAFSYEPFPRWAYQGDGWTVEKQLRPLQGENTICISYSLLGGDAPIELELRPLFALRGIHELMYQWNARLDPEDAGPGGRHHRIPATTRSPEVFFAHDGVFSPQPCWYLNTIYRRERERGYSGLEDLWMPGVVRWKLAPGQTVHFVCSSDPIDLARVVREADRILETAVPPVLTQKPDRAMEMLMRAAEQFVARTRDKGVVLMSSYPWAAPSGRDALISMPGLLLVTGKIAEAGLLLQSFASQVKDGLMPSALEEEGGGSEYAAADTSLWFIHAVGQYLRYGGDEAWVQRELAAVLDEIIDAYLHGTRLGIGADADGLLRTHEPGVPTTWMDAKVGDWVVTPRQGRPVSINALWYNALRIGAELSARSGDAERAEELSSLANCVKEAFNRRFWNAQAQCCFDVVEDHGVDPSIRPNQIFAVSLPYPVLDLSRHAAVIEKIRSELLTPVGVRTLSPRDRAYQAQYGGEVEKRDRAYHQGPAFPWLLGPLVTAFMRVNGRSDTVRAEAGKMLEGCLAVMSDRGLGQLAELFDGDPPHRPGGAIASARSVAELLRCYVEDVLDVAPATLPTPTFDTGPAPKSRQDGPVKFR